jgi:hypothetical protein
MFDYNLAGLATASSLALFFPGVGLLEIRRNRIERRKAHHAEQLKQLMIEEEKRAARMQDHVCKIDLDLSRTSVENGHVYAECVICSQPLYIGLALREEVEKW